MTAELSPIKTAAETALAEAFARCARGLPGDGAIAARREAAFRASTRRACRTGGSRSGNTPTCAR